MKFVLEFKSYYKVGDVVLIHYWYNGMVCEVVIKDIVGKKYLITHNIPQSKIRNAPDEYIKNSDIISIYRS